MPIATSIARKRSFPIGQTALPFDLPNDPATPELVSVAPTQNANVDTGPLTVLSSLTPPVLPGLIRDAIPVPDRPASENPPPVRPIGPPPHDFTIIDATNLIDGGTRAKIDGNLAAIRLLKRLQAEARPASPDEQRTLARYVGWGASELARIVGAAEPDDTRDQTTRAELRALLPESEFLAVRDTILNAHYSYVDVPRALWRAVQHLGFRGGRVLEPSVGVGHFIGTMPADLRATSQIHAVEIDPVTAAIAQQLYPTAHVQAVGFEVAKLPPAYFDLAIGNVPFGNYGVADPTFQSPERAPLARSIHNYFFARALDLIRPGGIVAFVTSRYTMDGLNAAVRKYLAQHADFLGAIRLPRTAFALAGTEVVADIIVLRRRAPGAPERHVAEWIDTDRQELSPTGKSWIQVPFSINRYFLDHPAQILGTAQADGRQHGRHTYTVDLNDERSFPETLERALDAFPRDSFCPRANSTNDSPIVLLSTEGAKTGEFHVDAAGHIYTTVGTIRQPLNVTGTTKARIQRFVILRDAYRNLLTAMLERRGPDQISRAQQSLRRTYNAFVQVHGPLNASINRRALSDDPESARLFALEDIEWIERRKGTPRKPVVKALADIFTKVTISVPDAPLTAASARDALVHSLAWKGRVDLPYMATLRRTTEAAVLADLAGTELFRDPITETWVPRDEFLSGDVLSKLDAAQARAAVDPETWQANADALQAVQPPRLEPEDIDIRLGSAWVPLQVYRDFAAAQLEISADDVRVQFINTEALSRWLFLPATDAARRRAATYELNVAERTFFELATDAANVARPEVRKWVGPKPDDTVPDPETTNALRESIRQVDERFREWWREDPARASALADLYNRTFNRMVLRTFEGSHLTLPGSNPAIDLRPHQRAVIWRVLQTGNTLIAHCVGAGKTFALTGAAMEKRRLGLARKPLIAVPNHMLEQWRRDILRLYPAAKVLVPSPTDLNGALARQRFLGRIAAGDWDVVLLTHSAFELIPVSKATFEEFINEQVTQLQAFLLETTSPDAKQTAKQIQLAIKRLKDKLEKRAKQWAKDQVLTFEELGVDMLLVDEAHLYKNLYFSTKLTRIAGLNHSESDRAIDMFLKVRFLNQKTHSRGVVFATGTPICNAVSELYTMQRYLAMEQLDALGLSNFDCWKQQFADVIELAEPAPEGGYRTRARLRQYSNVGELIVLFRQFADVLTADDLQLPVPRVKGGRPTLVTTEPPPTFADFLETLRNRVLLVRTRQVDPRTDNMLKITGEAAAAAVDMRLIDPFAPDHPNGRLAQAADRIARIYHDNDYRHGTQLVFLDIGIPRASELTPLHDLDEMSVALDAEADDNVGREAEDDEAAPAPMFTGRNLYEDLRQKLILRGVRARHIAFIHQAQSDVDKKRLYEAVNTGRIRLLLASSNKGGVGTNVQRRLVALHHLDVPWRPADLEQREGRILRQGNLFYEQDPSFEVEIIRYVTAHSFDEYRWGLLAMKQTFISQLLRGRLGLRTFEDQDTSQLSYEEAAAAASGDPRTLELLDGRQQLARLEARYTLHSKRAMKARSMVQHHHDTERYSRTQADRLPAFAAALDAWDRRVTLGTRVFSIDNAESRAELRDTLVNTITRRAAAATSNWNSSTENVGHVGTLYTIALYISPRTLDAETHEWQRSVALELLPQPAWTDVTSTVTHAAPAWNITTDPTRPPDFVRSFDTRWKSSAWLIELAAQYTQRANEAADARDREDALATRPFPQQATLESTRGRVRDLERLLQAVDRPAAPNAEIPAVA
jgi:N12 class adenine-specific DNA methylase